MEHYLAIYFFAFVGFVFVSTTSVAFVFNTLFSR